VADVDSGAFSLFALTAHGTVQRRRVTAGHRLRPRERRKVSAKHFWLDTLGVSSLSPRAGDLLDDETRKRPEPLPQRVPGEDAYMSGDAVGRREHGERSGHDEFVHRHDEAEPSAGPEHRQDRADGPVHIGHVLEDGERVRKIEALRLLGWQRGARPGRYDLVADLTRVDAGRRACNALRALRPESLVGVANP